MRSYIYTLLFICSVLFSLCYASSIQEGKPRTLVLMDEDVYETSHSTFFNALTARGHSLTFHNVFDENVRLEKYGQYHYDNLILFAPSAEDLGEHIKPDDVIRFVDSGRSLLVAINSNVSEPIREIANECGIDIDEEGTSVIDHFNYDSSDDGDHTTVVASNYIKNAPVMIGSVNGPRSPVLFRGIGHAAASGSRLITRVLTGSDSTYSHGVGKRVDEYPQSAGKDTLLVTALQTRNNARAVFSGSIDMFSNAYFSSSVNSPSTGSKWDKSGNEEFCIELSKWVFHERGLLRASNIQHKHANRDEINPKAYRVNDRIVYSVQLDEYDALSNTYKPYTGDNVQLEFVMIDPYVRTTLVSNGKGTYSTSFNVPDVYGVYKFVISYHRIGISNLDISSQVSVHPYRHNEFERFIDVAYPYYFSAFSIMAAFALFGALFLYQKDA